MNATTARPVPAEIDEEPTPLTTAEQRAKTIAHIRQCLTCGSNDPELMASLDDPDLSDEEITDFVETAHEYLRYERRQAFLRRNN
ncbi:hypothetical protein ACIBCT_20960 [Streptosporangium sp. NPDC050855]|uniref:hypothetical protein n=1 Tax=Streptosporangium sp. NPDC050855 TaxID=3366194 RepID=UPI003790BAF2